MAASRYSSLSRITMIGGALLLPAAFLLPPAHATVPQASGNAPTLTDYQLRLNPGGQSATVRWCLKDARTSTLMLAFGFQGWDQPIPDAYRQYPDVVSDPQPGAERCAERQITWDSTVPTGYVRIAGTSVGITAIGFGDFPTTSVFGYLGGWSNPANGPVYFIGNTCSPSCEPPPGIDLGQRFWLGPLAPPGPPPYQANKSPMPGVIEWAEPLSLGGADAISDYQVEVVRAPTYGSGTGNLDWTVVGRTTEKTFDLRTVNLDGGVYWARVSARNAAGYGLVGQHIQTTVAGVPRPPLAVTAKPQHQSATVTWQGSTYDGGSAILDYTVTASPGGQTCTKVGAFLPNTCTVTGLANGTAYTFTVTARNVIGSSTASESSDAVTPAATVSRPGPVSNLKAASARNAVRVTWSPPADLGGSDTVTYQFRVGRTPWVNTTNTNATVGAKKGSNVTVTVRAVNSAGASRSVKVSGRAR